MAIKQDWKRLAAGEKEEDLPLENDSSEPVKKPRAVGRGKPVDWSHCGRDLAKLQSKKDPQMPLPIGKGE